MYAHLALEFSKNWLQIEKRQKKVNSTTGISASCNKTNRLYFYALFSQR